MRYIFYVHGYINLKSLVVISTMARFSNFVPTCLIWDTLTQTTGEINYCKVILAWVMPIGTGNVIYHWFFAVLNSGYGRLLQVYFNTNLACSFEVKTTFFIGKKLFVVALPLLHAGVVTTEIG